LGVWLPKNNQGKTMSVLPQSITSEIERDFPGRFVLTEIEIQRLLDDIQRILKPSKNQVLRISFAVRLANGIIYQTNDFGTILKDENSGGQTITLIVVFAEVFEKENLVRRIVAQFSRGSEQEREGKLETIHGEAFNLNYHGINYRLRDTDRKSALKAIDVLETRLGKFRTWYSAFPVNFINFRNVGISIAVSIAYSLLVYMVASFSPRMLSFFNPPRFTIEFLQAIAFSMVSFVILALVLSGVIVFIGWLLPPTTIAIGDEIENHKKEMKIREFVLITVVLGIVLGVISGFAQDWIKELFSIGGASR
jgi:hypothetical protein